MIRYILFLFICIILSQCTLTDNDQPVPAFLEISQVDITTTPAQGEPTHKISDVWAYADNQLVGVFELPCKIPIIPNGPETELIIYPGFRNSGERSRSFIYNMLNEVRFTEALTPGETIERTFVFDYKDNVKFDFIEGFEGGSHIFTRDLDDDELTRIELSSAEVKSGAQAGVIELNSENSFVSVASVFDYNRADNAGLESYLELDYKNDIPFFVGALYTQEGQSVSQPLIALNPTDDWNKIYIDFTSILSSPQIVNYSVFVTTDLNALENTTSGTIYLDNMKFVHF